MFLHSVQTPGAGFRPRVAERRCRRRMPQEEEDESKQNKGKQKEKILEIPKNVKMLAGKFNESGETA